MLAARRLTASVWLTLSSFVLGAPVPIGDHSFEGNALNAGEWSNNLGPEWQETGGPNSANGFEERIGGFAADGTDHLGANSGHDVWQDLGAVYQPNTVYTLTIAGGHRAGFTQSGNQTGYALADATGAVYASAITDASPLAPGAFADAPDLVFDTRSDPAALGKTIRVLLRARGPGRSHFDDVRLEAVDVQPPGTAGVENRPATAIAATSATLRGEVTALGDGAPSITIFYGKENGGLIAANWDDSVTLAGTHTGVFSAGIQGLERATLYHFLARATNVAGHSWALPVESFETPALPATVANVGATGIGPTAATVGANISDNGGDNPTVTIFYGTADGGTTPGGWQAARSLGVVSNSATVSLSELLPDTPHFFRARAVNGGGTRWAPATASFTTEKVTLPSIETRAPSGVTGSTANLRGVVTDDGNDPPVVTLFYGLNNEGRSENWEHSIALGTKTGTFSQFVSGLLPETLYFFTLRAVNAAGAVWVSPSDSFRTTAAIPNAAVINEIHYDPADETSAERFIELHNPGDSPVNLSRWEFTAGIQYTFPPGTSIGVGGYLVVAEDPATILARYGVTALGPWIGQLSREGGTIDLRDRFGRLEDRVEYGVGFPWPTGARGNGGSAELIHPGLDNDVGGSWRTAGWSADPPPQATYVPAGSMAWRYRKGTSEASIPVEAWRGAGFVEDASWMTGQTPIGYGDDDDATVLDDMQGNYWSVSLRHEFLVDPLEIPSRLLLRIYVDDGCVVWLNGSEVWRPHAPPGQLAFDSSASNHEAQWEELVVDNAASFLVGGANVLAIHALNTTLNSSDFSIDAELRTPDPGRVGGPPTPGAQNSSFTLPAEIAPQIRQVAHAPQKPRSGEAVVITAKITDPDGMGPVTLDYQLVDPGAYLRKSDPAYQTDWTTVAMLDNGLGADAVAGDFLYTVELPASLQQHRRLVRYRIAFQDALDNRATVPYRDDGQPNFAYFVYDALPPWSGSFAPGETVRTFPANMMDDLPVYHLIANESDVLDSQYNVAFDGVHMPGTLVYDGVVYDHIEFENRGEASIDVSGKNKWCFHFNRARGFRARDDWGRPYPSAWEKMNFEGCSSPWAAVNRGMAGLDEAVNYRLFALAGVPSPRTNYLHFRVIDHALEADPSNQYEGDLWGLYLALEHPDGSFLKARGLPDGNVYKIEGGNGDKTRQGATQPTDSSDWESFYSFSNGTHTAGEWRARMHMPTYYSFRAVNRISGNVDLRTGFNHYFYHHPGGQWRVIPWDLDMMFISETHQGGTIRQRNSLNNPELRIEFANRCRELMDLMCEDRSPSGGQIGQLVDEYADIVNPPSLALTWADLDAYLWNHHPRTNGNPAVHAGPSNHKGNFFYTPFIDTRVGGSYLRTLVSADFEGFVEFVLDYTTDTYRGGAWSPGNGITAGYGFEYLKFDAADPDIPDRPSIAYLGAPGFPIDDLRFQSGAFSDPQGPGSFEAVKWRLAEIAAPGVGDYLPGTPRRYEVETLWESPELAGGGDTIQIPTGLARPGRTYRVRTRHKDNTGRWSHWSAAVEFTGGIPDTSLWRDNLMITEIMYHPIAPTGHESLVSLDKDDFEYIELKNVSNSITLDLADVTFTDGVDFDFAEGTITSLPPGGIVLVVKNIDAFEARYGSGHPVAGEFDDSNLANGGERIVLSYAGVVDLHRFHYSDSPPWPVLADGFGPSLTLIDPYSRPDHSLAINWTASGEAMGSPGADAAGCETIAQWMNAHFPIAQITDPSISGPLADADLDGIVNLLEYAFDTDPTAPTPLSEVLAPEIVEDAGARYLALRFRRRICRDHVTYTVEVGSDLSAWNRGPGHTLALEPPVDNGDGTETVTVRSLNELDASSPEFLRLEVSYTGP